MKTSILLLAAAATFTFATASFAGDSPKLAEFRASVATASGTTADSLDRSLATVSPKRAEFLASVAKSSGSTTDVVNRYVAGLPKQAEAFQVAPLK